MWVALFAIASVLLGWLATFRLSRRRLYELAAAVDAGEGEKLPRFPLIGQLHKFTGDTQDIMSTLAEMCSATNKRGGINPVWIGHILYFLLTEPADIDFVLKTCLEKDDLHRFLRKISGNGIVFAPVPIWRRRRKVMVPAFRPKIVESYVEIFSKQSEVLAEKLGARVDQGPFDAWPFFSSYTLDSVSETVMGVKINAQSKSDGPFLTAMTESLNLVCERIFKIWQQPDWLYKLSPNYSKHQHYLKVLHDFTDEVIHAKKLEIENESKNNNTISEQEDDAYARHTFLSLLISQSGKEKAYTNLELREEVISLTIAGTDTSAVGICFTLLLLARHQDAQERVYQELLDVYGKSKRALVKEDLPKLVYLERVVKESLRLYPPVPFVIRKVDKEITLPSGKRLPADCGVAIGIWGVHRNPRHWGADADQFQPDRFLPERTVGQHPAAYMPFSASPRNCLGYQYAMMSMKTSIATVLRSYKVLPAETGKSEPIQLKIDVMMKAANGYNIVLERRDT